MPELKNQSAPANPSAPTGHSSDLADDHLSHLYKMSRTAGLGTTDYVAINAMSVAAVLLGLASGMALMAPVMLFLPIAGVVAAVIALRQIQSSNGTQGGRSLAWLGLALSILLAGVVGTKQILARVEMRTDQQKIAAKIDELSAEINAGKWDAAYALFAPHFTQRVSKDQFIRTLQSYQHTALFGDLKAIRWNGVQPAFETDAEGITRAYTIALMEFTKDEGNSMRQNIVLRKQDDRSW
ncbi:MAG TPA: DUF4190 domain-containing protein, partial [Tepidisphaeraceae bacterium]